MSSIDDLDARHEAQRHAEERAAEKLNRAVNDAREDAADEYNASDQGHARAEQVEADRVMRLPTPQTLKEIGSVPPKDPTRFPSD